MVVLAYICFFLPSSVGVCSHDLTPPKIGLNALAPVVQPSSFYRLYRTELRNFNVVSCEIPVKNKRIQFTPVYM